MSCTQYGRREKRRPSWRPILGLALAALALRAQQVAIGPLIPQLQDQVGLTHASAGLLAAVPIWAMSAVAIPTALVARRRTAFGIASAAMAAIGVAAIVRGLGNSDVWIIVWTVPIGLGMGVALTILPALAKGENEHHPVLATGAYVTAIVTGSAVVGATAVPIASAFGTWRAPVLVYAGLHTVCVLLWLVVGGSTRQPSEPLAPFAMRLRELPAQWWRAAVLFSVQSLLFFSAVTWLPSIYVERGWSESSAAIVIAIMLAANIPGALVVTMFGDRAGGRRIQLVLAGVTTALGAIGIVVIPTWEYVWVAVFGVGLGAMYPLVLALPLDLSEEPSVAAAVSGAMLAVGYFVSAVFPLAIGLARASTGTYDFAGLVLTVLSLALIPLALTLGSRDPALRRRRTATEHTRTG